MGTRKKYKKRADSIVVAVQLNLDTDGFTYQKWGAVQHCKKGDWLVDNDGSIYTVDEEVFARTYQKKSFGIYVKTTSVWAEEAMESGVVKTKEGASHYEAGDYLVSNNKDGSDAYCMNAEKFHSMYELDEEV
jgi:hypothetical protein